MPFPCGLNVYITVEAVTLIGLTFVAATSFIINTVMAKKRKSGSSTTKPPQLPGATQQPKAATAPAAAPDASGSAQQEGGPVTATSPPVMKEIDARPEISPYASQACTIPFASPLTVPKDILLRSPKLHAAYEGQLPELPAITDDIGHILVHYLHTGSYESLKPKEVDTPTKQIAELRTSIRAYATARCYELPDLMHLAQKNIEKYGEGIALTHLLEITKEAFPTLSEADGWFLDYLKSRIRPHLEDPKALLGSNLLDQISSILSPNRVLLRTVLEMFCERITTRPEPLMSPITSPNTSRPTSPSPAQSPASVLQMRSRAVPREDPSPPLRKKTIPWPTAAEEASLSGKEGTAKPAAASRNAEQNGKASSKSAQAAKQIAPEVAAQPVAEPEPVVPAPKAVTPAAPAIEDQIKAALETEMKPVRPSTPVRRRRDSAKVIPSTPATPATPELEVAAPEPLVNVRPYQKIPILRAADSGFWDETPLESEPLKESTSSIIEIHPEDVLPNEAPVAVHELHATPAPQDEGVINTDTRDFASPVAVVADKIEKGKTIEIHHEPELPLAPDVSTKDPLEPFPDMDSETEAEPVFHILPVPEPLSDSKVLDRISEEEAESEQPKPVAKETEVPALAESDKAAKEPTVDLDTQAKPEPETEASHARDVPDDADAPGNAAPKTAEPSVEPVAQPAGEAKTSPIKADPEFLAAAPDVAEDQVPAKPATVAVPDPVQLATPTKGSVPAIISATPERQRSWRKRFMKYPVLFGRGM
jgi:hypothetical protein